MPGKEQIDQVRLLIIECVQHCRRIPEQLRVSYVFLQGMSAFEFATLHDLLLDRVLASPQTKVLK